MNDRQGHLPHENFRGSKRVVPTYARLSAFLFLDIANQRLTPFKERDNCEDQEKHETNLGDQGRGAGKTGETQKCRDERNDEEDNGVVKHGDCRFSG